MEQHCDGKPSVNPSLIRRKTVYVGCLQVIERILPASHIQRITVRQKRLTAKLLHIENFGQMGSGNGSGVIEFLHCQQ